MTDTALDMCLADICRGNRVDAFASDPAGTLADYELPADVKDEIVRCDVRRLLERGAHPILVMYLARNRGLTGPAYVAAARRQGETTEPADPRGPAAEGTGDGID